jgi:Uma2 family endonuclease
MTSAVKRVEVQYEIPTSDPRWILRDEDNVPESVLQDEVNRELIDVLATWLAGRGVNGRVGGNVALRWDPENPQIGVDPDVYVVEPDLPEGELAKSICTWKRGHTAPRLCVEVVSDGTKEKDYGDGPERYAAAGVNELWIFDPRRCGGGNRGGPFLLQLWRRNEQGKFRRVYAGEGPFRSEELDGWVVATDDGWRLRVADDPEGTRRWPTAAERERQRTESERQRAESERQRAESERQRAETERQRADGERAEKEALLEELRVLRALRERS